MQPGWGSPWAGLVLGGEGVPRPAAGRVGSTVCWFGGGCGQLAGEAGRAGSGGVGRRLQQWLSSVVVGRQQPPGPAVLLQSFSYGT